MFWNKKSQKDKLFADVSIEQQNMIGDKLSFAAAEAYKMLRTNLAFSFTEENEGHAKVIGITSSLKGEGKSLTSLNLAYTIAETGKKVLLVECDMRLPTMARRINLTSQIGLSDLLVGVHSGDEVIQKEILTPKLDILPAGSLPPNPAELLESKRMAYTVDYFSQYYDYVLLDLPPVTVVSDALIVSKLTSGMIVVVRQDYVDKSLLAETMRQLKHAQAKVLGFVMNSAQTAHSPYKKYYKKDYGYEAYANHGKDAK